MVDGKFLQVVCGQDIKSFRSFDQALGELNLEKIRKTLLKNRLQNETTRKNPLTHF